MLSKMDEQAAAGAVSRNDGRSRRQNGHGPWLSIAMWIVAPHDGKISVSGKKGHGSCFTVVIPCE